MNNYFLNKKNYGDYVLFFILWIDMRLNTEEQIQPQSSADWGTGIFPIKVSFIPVRS